ncbi:MAG TPA: GNAT family protein [Paucimonas sp.]|nr:GNAT family protein [Paucimonas sp.]
MARLETPNLILRDFVRGDLDAYRALRDDPKFRRFYNEDDVAGDKPAFLLDMFIEQSRAEPRTKYQFAVTSKAGELMGSCGVRLEGEGQASVGCELGRRWQAAGYAFEAAAAVVDFGFRSLGAHRIYAETMAENKAAILLCKRLGMRVEAEFVENRYFQGRWWNTAVLAILEHEWRARRA